MKKIIVAIVYLVLSLFSSATPVGFEVYNNIEVLPKIFPFSFAKGFSSYQRNGGNNDRGNFLYRDGSQYVMADICRPGTIYRLWSTGQNGDAVIRFYLDGAETPQINQTFSSFYSGNVTPFLSPLNDNDSKSSGGFYSYLPITFSNSCRITSTDNSFYYDVGLITYPTLTNIQTWTGNENSSNIRELWNNAGEPLGSYNNTFSVTNSFNLLPGKSKIIANFSGQRIINSIRLIYPDISVTGRPLRTVTDDGRAFVGFSKFVMDIPTNNNGVRLVRRLDYGINDQKANVSVDDVFVGEWFDEGGYVDGVWADSSFWISQQFTVAKAAITVKVSFVSSQADWNEFTYWTFAKQGTNEILSDTLDVRNSISENAHNYFVTNENWNGSRMFSYFDISVPDNLSWTTGVWIQAEWDELLSPAVDAPVGMFFGNAFGGQEVKSLLFGFKTNNLEHYCYFPMPFEKSAVLILTNRTDKTFSNLWCEVQHSNLQENMDELGWFHATYHSDSFENDDRDYSFLDTKGCGKFVGIVHWMKGIDLERTYLEGDERFYIDGNKTPAIYGTGAEDYYNGAWYFNRGTFSLPTHGNPNHKMPNGNDWTLCYRLHWPDSVPFRSSIKAGMEHGPDNDKSAEYSSVAFWYGKPDKSCMTLVDSIDIGNLASETAHLYTNGGHSTRYSMTSSYEGDDSDIMISDTGFFHNSFSKFRVAVKSNSQALLIRRRADHSFTNQKVNVEVNGQFVGQWLLAGYNQFNEKWISDEFVIPSKFLTNSFYADIQLTTTNGALWSEFRYDIFAVYSPVVPESVNLLSVAFTFFPLIQKKILDNKAI